MKFLGKQPKEFIVISKNKQTVLDFLRNQGYSNGNEWFEVIFKSTPLKEKVYVSLQKPLRHLILIEE